ncbi:MAG: HD domain-containing protein, partial [Bacteroidales bacterium]|nr:HD domain-containing protein [Bacteroidales bacterium]
MKTNKAKIINDPVHGFITLDSDLLYDIVAHRYFQRLARIKQLGLSCIVYPGAMHSRFLHALGAMSLMKKAIGVLRGKGVQITDEEAVAAEAAILLHDIGHGPFSHELEHFIIEGVGHETLSELFMERINQELGGRITMAIEIFKGTYEKKFLHQLVSSQLDMDRLDYLSRDSFFAGVSEGIVGTERIINMLNVHGDNLVVDEKGIYSIEKFIISRRLMHWQVYLHKTVIAADEVMRNILRRARKLINEGKPLPCTETLRYFFVNNLTLNDLKNDETIIERFSLLDDSDIVSSSKQWMSCDDFVLST